MCDICYRLTHSGVYSELLAKTLRICGFSINPARPMASLLRSNVSGADVTQGWLRAEELRSVHLHQAAHNLPVTQAPGELKSYPGL